MRFLVLGLADRRARWVAALLALAAASCELPEPVITPPEVERLLTLDEARKVVLELINRDRVAAGLEPLTWDPVAAAAAQRHVRDLAEKGYTAHRATDGSTPEARYSAAGGTHAVQENAACFFDAKRRSLDPAPQLEERDLRTLHAAFMAEVPPDDGHRRNVLGAWHTGVGIGIAMPQGVEQPCLVQLYVASWGTYEPLPDSTVTGDSLVVAGELRAPATPGGVGLSRTAHATPLSPDELNREEEYVPPPPAVLFLSAGYESPFPVTVEGQRFSITIPPEHLAEPGEYAVSVWARFPDQREMTPVSLRTIAVVTP